MAKGKTIKSNFANWIWDNLGVSENADAPIVWPFDHMIHDD
jgi:hypothetical protein